MCLFVCLFGGLDFFEVFFWPIGYLLRHFLLCYRLITFLSTLVSHSIVLARFCFKSSLVDRSSFFEMFDFFRLRGFFVLYCIASGAKLSFASV